MDTGEYTKQIAGYVAALAFQRLPAAVVSQAKIVLLDTLGSMLAASAPGFAAPRIIRRLVREAGGAPQASVVGLEQRLPAIDAALANGTLADNVELDDSHPRTGAHIAAAVIPAALAVAEWRHASGSKLIEGLVAAYDVECRAILAAGPSSMYARGFHPSAVFGAFGAATAAAKVLGLDAPGTVNALGLAGCQASGLMAWETDPTQMPKSLQMGLAARNGVTAAALAEGGFSGPPAIFEGRYNAPEAFSDRAAVAPLTEALGSRYEICLTGLKLYPVCRFLHASLDAFFEIQQRERPAAAEIDEIAIRMPHAGVKIVDNNELRSHSAQYVLAIAALRGELKVEDIYRDEREDPQVAALMRRVHLAGDPELDAAAQGRFSEPAMATVRLRDGRTFSARADAASGDPEKALDWPAIAAKFERMAAPVAGAARTGEIIALVSKVEALSDVSQIGDLLR